MRRVRAGLHAMTILVTGSTGHLGEAIIRTLRAAGTACTGLDITPSPFTDIAGSIVDRGLVAQAMRGIDSVIHTATLHKPHLATHSRQDFVDTNITGTLNLLEEATRADVRCFIYTSTTSVFGDALTPGPGAPAAWITEGVQPIAKNIYGSTKAAAEDLCQLFHRNHGLPCLVLRTSRFFPEKDDNKQRRDMYADENAKVNEFLFRRVDIEDAVSAHLLAISRAPDIGFARYIISATTPFRAEDCAELGTNTANVVGRYSPAYKQEYTQRGWKMFPTIDRVYVNERARTDLGWQPRYDFHTIIDRLRTGRDWRSPLARAVGSKGYHTETFTEGPYPIETG